MEDERAGDLRVPLISAFFCLCVIAGGVFLILYVFFPELSKPWFPIPAFLLIGSPWLFWLFTYIYTCIKRCCIARQQYGHTGPYRQNTRTASIHPPAMQNDKADQQESLESPKNSESPLTASV